MKYTITSNVDITNRNGFKIINALKEYIGLVYFTKNSEDRQINAKSMLGL